MAKKEVGATRVEYSARESYEWKKTLLDQDVSVPELPRYVSGRMLEQVRAVGLEPYYIPPITPSATTADDARYLRLLEKLKQADYISSPPLRGQWILTTDRRTLMPSGPLTRYLNRWQTAYYEPIEASDKSCAIFDQLQEILLSARFPQEQTVVSAPSALEHYILARMRGVITPAPAEWTKTKLLRKSSSPDFTYKDDSGVHVGRIFDHLYLAVKGGQLIHEPGRFARYRQGEMRPDDPQSTPIRIRPLIRLFAA